MRLFTLFICMAAALSSAAGGVFNVKDFDAKGDGKTLDSPAINAPTEEGIEKTVLFNCENIEILK